jgi:FMN-dependent NADH-azoreductase
MKTPSLLLIQASPRGERSHSRKLGKRYLDTWQSARSEGHVVVRDLGHAPPPFVTEAWVAGAFAGIDAHPDAADAIAVSNRYVDELLAADEIVIATPIYNLSIPAALKAWIDQIVRVGLTFGFTENGLTGLLVGKKAKVIVASGSDFRPEGALGAFNFIEPYLRGILGFIGITDVEFVYAHSLNDGNPLRDSSLAAAGESVLALASA